MSAPICNACSQSEGHLVKSCDTKDCNINFHPSCLEVRVKSGKKSCPNCEFPIVVRETTTFAYNKCFKMYFGIFYVLLMIIGGTYSNIVFAVGTNYTINTHGYFITKHSNEGIGLVGFISFLISLIFWQFPFKDWNEKKNKWEQCCCSHNLFKYFNRNKYNKKDSYFSMLMMFSISKIIIFGIHILGQFIINDYKKFNYITFLEGLLSLIMIICGMFIGIGIPTLIIQCTIKEFLITKTSYGKQLKPLPEKIVELQNDVKY